MSKARAIGIALCLVVVAASNNSWKPPSLKSLLPDLGGWVPWSVPASAKEKAAPVGEILRGTKKAAYMARYFGELADLVERDDGKVIKNTQTFATLQRNAYAAHSARRSMWDSSMA